MHCLIMKLCKNCEYCLSGGLGFTANHTFATTVILTKLPILRLISSLYKFKRGTGNWKKWDNTFYVQQDDNYVTLIAK